MPSMNPQRRRLDAVRIAMSYHRDIGDKASTLAERLSTAHTIERYVYKGEFFNEDGDKIKGDI